MKRGSDATAVANFLASLDGLTQSEAFANARADAKSYGWNDATLTAVIDGIAARSARRAS